MIALACLITGAVVITAVVAACAVLVPQRKEGTS